MLSSFKITVAIAPFITGYSENSQSQIQTVLSQLLAELNPTAVQEKQLPKSLYSNHAVVWHKTMVSEDTCGYITPSLIYSHNRGMHILLFTVEEILLKLTAGAGSSSRAWNIWGHLTVNHILAGCAVTISYYIAQLNSFTHLLQKWWSTRLCCCPWLGKRERWSGISQCGF